MHQNVFATNALYFVITEILLYSIRYQDILLNLFLNLLSVGVIREFIILFTQTHLSEQRYIEKIGNR